MTKPENRDTINTGTADRQQPTGNVKSAKPNFKPKTIWTGDNLLIMRGMNSVCVDMIYFDPPFNSDQNYAAPIGSKAAGATFKDIWTLSDIDEEWIDLIAEKKENRKLHRVLLSAMSDSDKSYLTYMAPRILEMKRILKPNGTIYLHCDPTMSHYLKLMMDAIFDKDNFRNEIIWCYTSPSAAKRDFPRKHDTIFRYVNGNDWVFNTNSIKIPYKKLQTGSSQRGIYKKDVTLDKEGKIPETWWVGFSPVGRLKNERTGFKTQKPLALLDRIIKASSNEGDIVFDPFCGCATTLASADRLNRNWIGIDISSKATDLIKIRIEQQQGLFQDIISRKDIPQRTDFGKLPPPRSHFNFLYGEQRGKCNGCKTKPENDMLLEVDHIIAKSKGGQDNVENLQLLCRVCNNIKRDKPMEYLTNKLKKIGIGVEDD